MNSCVHADVQQIASFVISPTLSCPLFPCVSLSALLPQQNTRSVSRRTTNGPPSPYGILGTDEVTAKLATLVQNTLVMTVAARPVLGQGVGMVGCYLPPQVPPSTSPVPRVLASLSASVLLGRSSSLILLLCGYICALVHSFELPWLGQSVQASFKTVFS